MSKIIYKLLGNAALKPIIKDMQTASERLNIDFFGVGALARNVWYVMNDEAARGTKDVDFGIYVSTAQMYHQLKSILIREFSYTQISENPFCLMSPYQIPVDLLPFGAIEQAGKVMIEGKGLVTINLEGFVETYHYGLIETSIEGDTIQVCSIPCVVLLKLIAYDDRPSYRLNDPVDIASILKHYPEIETEFIWDEYNFLYEAELEHEAVGIKVLGYELSKIISKNAQLVNRILIILDKAIHSESDLAKNMIQDATTDSIQLNIEKLKLLKEGIVEGLKKQ
ncbi:MAG: hypothetical protein AAGG68_31115 [Bacteroidota bacterium]